MARTASFIYLLIFTTFAFADLLAPVTSVFHLTKNTNRNQVHYSIEVDEECRPSDKNPLQPYWLMREQGNGITEKLRFWEQPGYGVHQPRNIDATEDGYRFQFIIRGVPDKRLEMQLRTVNETCVAQAITDIDGTTAVLQRIDIEVSGWANVHRVEIFGVALEGGRPVSEITHQD